MSLLELLKATFVFVAVTSALDRLSVSAESDNNATTSTMRFNQTSATLDYHVVMLDAVNKERIAHGLPSLCRNIKLRNAALLHAKDMATNDFVNHTGSNGSSIIMRAEAQGYEWNSLAENIAAGQASVGSVMRSWMNSPPHLANVLSTAITMFEVGYYFVANSTYKHYWTQFFGSSSIEKCSSV
ncbi:unnamed protein product [Peronospora belbahrii]|uniref:SCP domain-containing protein n=1 Tax=Peronospora belbahrii TaxID=622444 RepID=A0AAU9KX22_9STRA|nr:unnamed protein product [Peronospora belbahrii]CAH0519585.1 unnamed protein product [Peronospora belbahrii]